jgi:hypothetical protein
MSVEVTRAQRPLRPRTASADRERYFHTFAAITMVLLTLVGFMPMAGATVRMPILFPAFGEAGWVGIFGPIFTLGGAFLLLRWLLTNTFDRWLAAGYAAMVVVYVGASTFALSDAWSRVAETIFNL